MEFKLNDLLSFKLLEKSELVNDKNYLNSNISGVTIMETPGIAKWMSGEEILLTSLYPILNLPTSKQQVFFTELNEKKITALLIKDSGQARKIIEYFINELQFAVVFIDSTIPFIEITNIIMEQLLNDKVSKLEYFKKIHDEFMELAVTSRDKKEILQTTKRLIEKDVTLYDGDKNYLLSTSEEKTFCWDKKKALINQLIKYPYYEDQQEIIVPIELVDQRFYLVIHSYLADLNALNRIALEQGIQTLVMKLIEENAILQVESKYKRNVIDELLNGSKEMIATIYQQPSMIRCDLLESMVVTSIHISTLNKQANYKDKYELFHKIRKSIAKHIARKEWIIVKGETIVALWQTNDYVHYKQELKGKWEAIFIDISKRFPGTFLSVGIGNEVTSILNIESSYKEAEEALRIGLKSEESHHINFFSELGIYRLINEIKDKDQLLTYIPPAIIILKEESHDLYKTLKAYLEHDQNSKKVAEVLNVHYKTVVYRLEKMKEMTKLNLTSLEELFNLQFGFKILEFLKMDK